MLEPIQVVVKAIDGITQPFQGIIQQSKLLENAIGAINSMAERFKQSLIDGSIGKQKFAGINDEMASLARSINKSYYETEKFTKGLGLTAEQAEKAVKALREMSNLKLDPKDQLQALQKNLGESVSKEQFKKLQEVANPGEKKEGLGAGVGQLVEDFGKVGLAINGVKEVFHVAEGVGMSFYDKLIKANVDLQQQLLGTKTTLVGTNDIFKAGVQIKDPGEAIKALDAPINAAIAKVRRGALDLTGVTSAALIPVFQNIAGQSASINASLQQSADLTLSFSAALGTLKIPLQQSSSEISAILQGNINQYTTIAKSLNITNEMVRAWKANGTVVQQLTKRLEAFRAGNAMAANTIEGVMSNIQEIWDEIVRIAGSDFLQPITDGLNVIYHYLKDHTNEFADFIAELAKTAFGMAQSLLQIGMTIVEMIGPENMAKIVTAAKDLFGLVGTALAGLASMSDNPIFKAAVWTALGVAVAAAFGPVALLIPLIPKAAEGLSLIPQAFSEVTGATGAVNDAIDSIGKGADESAQRALHLQARLKYLADQETINGKLTAEQQKERKKLGQEIAIETTNIDNQISSLKALQPQNEAQKNAIAATIEMLTRMKNSLDNTKLASIAIPDKGTILGQLDKEAANFAETLKKGVGDPTMFENAAKGMIDVVAKQREMNAISREDAETTLRAIVQNDKLSKAIRLSAEKALIENIESINKEHEETQKADQAELDAQVAKGQKTAVEGAKEAGRAKAAALEEELEVAKQVHQEKLKLLEDELQANLKAADTKIADAQKELDEAQQGGDDATIALAKRKREKAEEEKKTFEKQAAGEKEKIDREADNKERTLSAQKVQNEVETQRKVMDARVREIDRAEAKATDAMAKAETARQIEIQKLVNSGGYDPEEIEKKKLDSTRARLNEELKLEKNHVAELEKLPKPDNPEEAEKREKMIRDSKRKTSETVLKLLENEHNQQENLIKTLRHRIEIQLKEADNAYKAENQTLEKQLQLQKSIGKSIDEQQRLLKARQEYQNSTAEMAQSMYSGAISLLEAQFSVEDKLEAKSKRKLELQKELNDAAADPEKQKQIQLELTQIDKQEKRDKQIRDLKTEAKKVEIEQLLRTFSLEEDSFRLEQEKTKLLREQERIKLKMQAIEAKANTAEKIAALAKVQADPHARPEEVRAAQLGLQAAQMKEDGLKEETKAFEEEADQEDKLSKVKEDNMHARQGKELSQKQVELAQLQENGPADVALSNKLLGYARGNVQEARADADGKGRFRDVFNEAFVNERDKRNFQKELNISGYQTPEEQRAIANRRLSLYLAAGEMLRSGKPVDDNTLSSTAATAQTEKDKKAAIQLALKQQAVQSSDPTTPGQGLAAQAGSIVNLGKAPATSAQASAGLGAAPGSRGIEQLIEETTAMREILAKKPADIKQHNTFNIYTKDGKLHQEQTDHVKQQMLNLLYDVGRTVKQQRNYPSS